MRRIIVVLAVVGRETKEGGSAVHHVDCGGSGTEDLVHFPNTVDARGTVVVGGG